LADGRTADIDPCLGPGGVGEVAAGSAARRLGLSFWLAVAWLALVAVGAAGAGLLPIAPPDQIDWGNLAAKPGVAGHVLGTDSMGRDMASRLIFGSRVSLIVGFFAPCLGLVLGALLGVLAGFYRGPAERVILGVIDTFLAFPRLIILLMAICVFGSNLVNLTLALGFVCLPPFARVSRAATLKLAEREFVVAARAGGASDASIVWREIVPNVIPGLLVYLLLVMGLVIVAEGSLGFLGLSVPSPTPSWGGMMSEGREVLDQAPHVAMLPTAVMFLTILSVNLIGDRLRGWNDARESQL
jgi:peptide/nickel transport system permease protein